MISDKGDLKQSLKLPGNEICITIVIDQCVPVDVINFKTCFPLWCVQFQDVIHEQGRLLGTVTNGVSSSSSWCWDTRFFAQSLSLGSCDCGPSYSFRPLQITARPHLSGPRFSRNAGSNPALAGPSLSPRRQRRYEYRNGTSPAAPRVAPSTRTSADRLLVVRITPVLLSSRTSSLGFRTARLATTTAVRNPCLAV